MSFVKAATDTTVMELEDVTVTAQRPLVRMKADRMVYDVKNDGAAKTSMITEILRKVPFVTVDGNNNIRVKGSSNFKIYKNGRPDQSFSNNPGEVLSSIPASIIKRIEVITEPGAKYDAEGLEGILNIVMDDGLTVKGVSGNVSAGIGTLGQPYGSLWGTAQYGKLTTSAYLSVQKASDRASKSKTHSEYTYKDTGNLLLTDMQTSNPGGMYSFGMDASYEVDSLNLLTVSFSGFGYDVDLRHGSTDTMLGNDGGKLYSYDREYVGGSDYEYFDMNAKVDYQHLTRRKGESFNLSYLLSTTRMHRNKNESFSNIMNEPAYSSSADVTRNNYMEHTLQADWIRPLTERHALDFGAKYILRTNDSRSRQEQDYNEVSGADFEHATHVAALYGEYSLELDKLSLICGLRYEWAYMKAEFKDGITPGFHKTIGDLVPSLTTSWRINDANDLKLSYTMRINRPGISYLNPAVFKYPTNVLSGNPDLESANRHNVELSYSLMKPKLYMNVSASAAFSDNQITTIQYVDDGLMHSTYGNVGRFVQTGIYAYLQWRLSGTTTFMLNGNVQNTKYYNTDMHLDNRRWNVNFHSQLTQQLPWKLNMELSVGRSNGEVTDMYSYSKGSYYHSMNLTRSFLKDDRMTVRLLALNPFHGKYEYYKSRTVNGDYTGFSDSRMEARLFSISLSYRFGSMDTNVKRTRKSIVNDDLIGRK